MKSQVSPLVDLIVAIGGWVGGGIKQYYMAFIYLSIYMCSLHQTSIRLLRTRLLILMHGGYLDDKFALLQR